MAGGNGMTMRVSAALRAANLPILRWSDKPGSLSRTGITVTKDGPSNADIRLRFHAFELEREVANDIETVLLAQGFIYHRFEGHTRSGPFITFTVYRTAPAWLTPKASQAVEPAPVTADDPEQALINAENAAIATSGLQVAKLTRTDWQISHGGRRNAYTIKRTGTGERARYTATAKRDLHNPIAKNLRTLAEVLAAVKTDIDTQEA